MTNSSRPRAPPPTIQWLMIRGATVMGAAYPRRCRLADVAATATTYVIGGHLGCLSGHRSIPRTGCTRCSDVRGTPPQAADRRLRSTARPPGMRTCTSPPSDACLPSRAAWSHALRCWRPEAPTPTSPGSSGVASWCGCTRASSSTTRASRHGNNEPGPRCSAAGARSARCPLLPPRPPAAGPRPAGRPHRPGGARSAAGSTALQSAGPPAERVRLPGPAAPVAATAAPGPCRRPRRCLGRQRGRCRRRCGGCLPSRTCDAGATGPGAAAADPAAATRLPARRGRRRGVGRLLGAGAPVPGPRRAGPRSPDRQQTAPGQRGAVAPTTATSPTSGSGSRSSSTAGSGTNGHSTAGPTSNETWRSRFGAI